MAEYTASPTCSNFHKSDAFVRGLMGPVGSGKSVAECWEVFRRANEQAPMEDGIRRTRWAIIRNTYKELKTTTYATWADWFASTGTFNIADMVFKVKYADVEAEIIFQALDRPADVSKLLSLELTGAFVNEAREIPKAIIDMLQLRVGRYPSKRDGGPTWHGIIMDTNPPDQDHWWYTTFEELRPQGWELFKQPSGISEHAENIDNLPDGYYTTMMASQSDDWRRIYRDGEYGYVHEGKAVFPEYVDSIHCADHLLGPIPGMDVYIGIDFGLTPAATFAQRDSFGRWAFIDEIVTFDMDAVELGDLLNQRINERYQGYNFVITGDPAGEQRSQADKNTPFKVLRAQGVMAKPAHTNDPSIRQKAVGGPMKRLIQGKPGLIVCPERCPQLRKAFMGGYHYKRMQVSGDERFQNEPDKNKFSHVAESAEYLMLGGGEGRKLVKTNTNFSKPVQVVKKVSVFN